MACMAFAAAFSPVCCQEIAPVLRRLVLPSIVPHREVPVEPRVDCLTEGDELARHDGVDGKDASPAGSSWAWTRLQEQTRKELDAWKQASEENRLKDSLDALDAAFQALRLAEVICRDCLSNDVSNVGLPSNLCDALLTGMPTPPPNSADERLEVEAKSHGDREQSSVESPQSPHVHSPLSPQMQTLECQSTADSSRLSTSLVRNDKVVKAAVSGRLTVEGDIAMDASSLQEVLQSVLLQIGEVKDVKLTCTRPWQQSFLSGLTSMEGYGLFGSQDTKGGFVDGSTEFAFEVVASDPNDFEPLRETLLLEAECGGARYLLPMLAEQLCSDDLATPRHLKVRIEVSKESQT